MAPTPDSFEDMTRAIQLALAPVFLVTGIAGILNVMAGRLARIIDRSRWLTERRGAPATPGHDTAREELEQLERRRHLTSVGITACTIAALLVCVVIALLFLEVMLGVPLKWLSGVLFTAAIVALIVGLAFFLREVHWAMRNVRRPPDATR
jgi:hypothetical protein